MFGSAAGPLVVHFSRAEPGQFSKALKAVQYFALGHSSRCFWYIRDWVEKKIRRHLARARQRRGLGWKRWSKAWLYGDLGLFNDYRVAYYRRLADRPSGTAP